MKGIQRTAAGILSLSLSIFTWGCSTAAPQKEPDTKAYIEETLNLANNEEQEWTYSADSDAWVLSVVSAVANPELPDQQGVSVCVPGAYVLGIDTDGDGKEDVSAAQAQESIKGSLVIDSAAQITSSNGQVYSAATAPVILNTGAAGYGSQKNSAASTTYASEGYINVACGNRGKQDTAVDAEGETYYTGDAPSCLVDQKAAARFVKYNILLGNLPGDVDRFVSTGGSGGGAHATMFAATSNNPDFYGYQAEAGAVGVYANEDGTYTTTVTIDGQGVDLSDGAWGCIAYSPITSLAEADMALAFEYYLDSEYEFGSAFQKQLAEYLAQSYMEYINAQDLSVQESEVGFDLNGDGKLEDTIALSIEYDADANPETRGYSGTYLDLYLAEFTDNLQWYVENLDYAEGWTWFDENGEALSDEQAASLSLEQKIQAFLTGRYAKGSMNGMGMMGTRTGMGQMKELPEGENLETGKQGFAGKGGMGNLPDGELPDGELPEGDLPDGGIQDGMFGGPDGDLPFDNQAMPEIAGTPDAGTTQSASGSRDSSNYASYEEMVEAYRQDIEEISAGDSYGNNIVSLYDPLQYIGQDATEDPAWIRMVMGASEGDMSMFSSLNLQLAFLNAGVDAQIEWQWDGGHVPSEIFGNSLSLYVDRMVAESEEGTTSISKQEAQPVTANGTAQEATGTDLSSWVQWEEGAVSFQLADVAAYRTASASKAIPGFDVLDYGQEDYVFGSKEKDARHWNAYLLEIFETYADTLAPLFNQNSAS